MLERKKIEGWFFHGKWEGIFEESDGNKRCFICNKKIRPGQLVIQINSAAFRRRATQTYFQHKECPEKSA